MTAEADIIRALQQATTAAVAASTMPALPIKYLMVDAQADGVTPWSTPADKKWLELVWIPNNRVGDYWGNERNHQGLFRLILHWPNDGGGIYTPLGVIGSIGDQFDKSTLLQGVQVYDKPNFTGMQEMGDETLFPLSLRYQSYRS